MFIRWQRRRPRTAHQRGSRRCRHKTRSATLTPVLLHSVRVNGASRHVRVWTFGAGIRECCLGDRGAREAWWRRIDESLDDLVAFKESEALEPHLDRIEAQLGKVVPPPSGRARRTPRNSGPSRDRSSFAILGLVWPCSEAEIRAAWKRAAFERHPDRGGTHADFVALQRAYEECLAVVHASVFNTA